MHEWDTFLMNSMKLVIPLPTLYWSIHTKDESKRGTAFAFIFGVNWLWHYGVTASFGASFHEIKCHGMTSFMEFIFCDLSRVLLVTFYVGFVRFIDRCKHIFGLEDIRGWQLVVSQFSMWFGGLHGEDFLFIAEFAWVNCTRIHCTKRLVNGFK